MPDDGISGEPIAVLGLTSKDRLAPRESHDRSVGREVARRLQ